MSREKILMLIGVLVLISPWSGIPLAWLTWVLLVLGLLVIGIGFTLVRRDSSPPLPPARSEEESQSRSSHIAFS